MREITHNTHAPVQCTRMETDLIVVHYGYNDDN